MNKDIRWRIECPVWHNWTRRGRVIGFRESKLFSDKEFTSQKQAINFIKEKFKDYRISYCMFNADIAWNGGTTVRNKMEVFVIPMGSSLEQSDTCVFTFCVMPRWKYEYDIDVDWSTTSMKLKDIHDLLEHNVEHVMKDGKLEYYGNRIYEYVPNRVLWTIDPDGYKMPKNCERYIQAIYVNRPANPSWFF